MGKIDILENANRLFNFDRLKQTDISIAYNFHKILWLIEFDKQLDIKWNDE
jgi:hypothetical protein